MKERKDTEATLVDYRKRMDGPLSAAGEGFRLETCVCEKDGSPVAFESKSCSLNTSPLTSNTPSKPIPETVSGIKEGYRLASCTLPLPTSFPLDL
jgi:hypothetical protein